MNIRIAETEQRKAERWRKRATDEPVSALESSFDEEEEAENSPSTSSSSGEEEETWEREATPPRPDLVEDLESPPAF